MTYSRNTNRAIRAYGREACIRAAQMNEAGEGPSSIAFQGPTSIKTTNQADAAINAGREIIAADLIAKTREIVGEPMFAQMRAIATENGWDDTRFARELKVAVIGVARERGLSNAEAR